MIRHGRSTLRGITAAVADRPRPWGRRRALTAAALALLSLLVFTIVTEALAPTGPGRFLYVLHDALWVPFWARIWTRAGVWSLLWLGPFVVLIACLAVEFMGVAAPLRGIQVAVLRRTLRSRWGAGLVRLQQILGWRRNHEGLLVAVARAELGEAADRARASLEAGMPLATQSLVRAVLSLAYLRAASPPDQVAAVEAMALVTSLAGEEATVRASAQLRRIWSDPVADEIDALLNVDETRLAQLRHALVAATLKPAEAALVTLGVSQRAGGQGHVAARSWFTTWARLRLTPDRPRPDLAEAETLIDFEFWAARSETAMRARNDAGDRASWLATILPGVPLARDMGEMVAAGHGSSGAEA